MERNGIRVLIETLGSKGAKYYIIDDKSGVIPGLRAECVDSCGAGDAFWGGFLTTLIQEGVKRPEQLKEELVIRAVRRGNIAGWLCVQKKGAMESLPTAEDVARYGKELYG